MLDCWQVVCDLKSLVSHLGKKNPDVLIRIVYIQRDHPRKKEKEKTHTKKPTLICCSPEESLER
jgi:hypothetical protein